MILLSCNKEKAVQPQTTETSNGQNALIFEFSGTDCSLCGGYAWPAMENIKSKYGHRAIIMDCHVGVNDTLINQSVSQLASYFQVSGTPTIYTGMQSGNLLLPGVSAQIETNLSQRIDAMLTAPKALLEISIQDLKRQNKQVNYQASVKFHQAVTGQYYLAAYILEDSISGLQLMPTGNRVPRLFHHVFRKCMSSYPYGNALVQDPQEGQIINSSQNFNLESNWKERALHLVLAVWNYQSGKPVVVNAVEIPIP